VILNNARRLISNLDDLPFADREYYNKTKISLYEIFHIFIQVEDVMEGAAFVVFILFIISQMSMLFGDLEVQKMLLKN